MSRRLATGSGAGGLPRQAMIARRWRWWNRQDDTWVGLDFGAGSLKLAQVRMGRQGPQLETFAVMPQAAGLAGEGGIVRTDQVADDLRHMGRSLALRQRRAGVVLGGPGILMRYIAMPRTTESELRYAMRFEAAQYLPIAEDQLLYDFATVPEASGVPENQVAVFLAGTRRNLVETYINTLTLARLRTQAAELDCLAVGRALQALGYIEPQAPEPFALLDVGEAGTRITVFRFGVPMLTRTVPLGVQNLRVSVAEAQRLVPEDAETALRNSGFGPASPLLGCTERWLRGLAEAVLRSIEFFLIQHRNLRIANAFIIGGGALMPGFAQALAAELGEGIRTGAVQSEPPELRVVTLQNLKMSPGVARLSHAVGPLLIPALGSALRGGAL